LSNGVTYEFEIRADHEDLVAGAIQRASGTPAASPGKPANLIAVPNDGFATLYLDDPDPSDDVPPAGEAVDYEVCQSPGYLGGTADCTEDSDEWDAYGFTRRVGDPTRLETTVHDLENDRTYAFRVRVVGGGASYSETRVTPSATPGEEPDPRAGFTLSATPGNNQVALEWNKQSDIAGFQYRMDLTKDDWLGVPGSTSDTTAYVKTGLTDGDEASFQVRSVTTSDRTADDYAEIKRSSVVTVTVGLDRTAPDTTFTSMPEMMTESMTAEFVIETEEGATLECSLDGRGGRDA
jgi:hypothetical protein